jgi:hypothetical protein
MTKLENLALAGAALAIFVGLTPHARAEIGAANPSTDVAGFIGRRTDRSEWSKKAIDTWSRREIDPAQIDAVYGNLRSLKCFEILSDGRALRLKYAGNPEILALLGSGDVTKFVTRLPVRIAIPRDSHR